MKKRVLMVVMALCLLFVAGSFAAEPGTDGDPLITRSYVESVIYPATRFKVVAVNQGQSLILGEGSEAILRMGTATVIGTQKGGLSDVTMGFDLADGNAIQGNHHLIAPLNDGRGIKAHAYCLIMVKGDYSIK